MDSSLVGLIVLGLIAVAMASFFILPRIRSSAEKDKRPIYEEIGIGWAVPVMGMLSGSSFSPYRLSLYDTFFVIATVTKKVVPYTEVIWLKKGKLRQLSMMLRDGRKATLMFPRNSDQVMEIFRSKGVLIG